MIIPMHTFRRLVPAALLMATALLAGCSTITGKREPFITYAPHYSAPAIPAHAPAVVWQLVIELPLTSDALDTRRIAIMPSPGVLQVYKGARWRDAPPALLRSLLVQAFEETGRIVGVGTSGSGLRADYSLTIELREFTVDYRDGIPHATIGLNAKLVNFVTNRVLFARTFRSEAPMADSSADAANQAFEQTLNNLLPQMVDWTLENGEVDWKKHEAAKPMMGTNNLEQSDRD